jgi:hypothetical protein
MPLITDILTVQPVNRPFFVVDKTKQLVAIQEPVGVGRVQFNSAYNDRFRRGDSFTIVSAGIIFPESFQSAIDSGETYKLNIPSLLYIYLCEVVSPFAIYDLQELGTSSLAGVRSGVNCPMENYEWAFNTFVDVTKELSNEDHPRFLDSDFQINVRLVNLWASMIGVPSTVDGKKFYVTPFLKIQHNIQMYATPSE